MAADIRDDIWKALRSPTAWAIAVGKLGILVSREAVRFRSGAIDREEFRVRTGGHVGSSAGIVLGAATGAALGMVMPVIGNVAGAFAGGVIGAMAGEELGRAAASVVEGKVEPEAPAKAKDGSLSG